MNKPWKYEIEATEGCNLFCEQCAIRTLWKAKKELHFMEPDLADALSKSIDRFTPKVRVEFAMHGEPTLNKNILEILHSFRTNIPKVQIVFTTNGVIIRKEGDSYVKSLFDAGVNIIYLSSYNGEQDNFNIEGVEVVDFYSCDQHKYNPHCYHSPAIKWILKVGDLKKNTGKSHLRTLYSMAGNVDFDLVKKYGVFPLQKPLEKACSKPFHDMCVDYDGTIVSCCLDWIRAQKMGKYPEEELDAIWFNENYTELREMLSNRNRRTPLCSKCDYNGGARLGLITKPRSKPRQTQFGF